MRTGALVAPSTCRHVVFDQEKFSYVGFFRNPFKNCSENIMCLPLNLMYLNPCVPMTWYDVKLLQCKIDSKELIEV